MNENLAFQNETIMYYLVLSNSAGHVGGFNVLSLLFCSTFVCPTEIIAFSDRVAEFKAINCEVSTKHLNHMTMK